MSRVDVHIVGEFVSRVHNYFLAGPAIPIVNLFGPDGQRHSGSMQRGDPDEVVSKLDTALTAIFSEDGKRTVIYYMNNRFGLSLEQAGADPGKLESALTGLLGEIGWMVVKRAILEEFWEKKIGIDETNLVKSASLREAFGFVRGFGLGTFIGPK